MTSISDLVSFVTLVQLDYLFKTTVTHGIYQCIDMYIISFLVIHINITKDLPIYISYSVC